MDNLEQATIEELIAELFNRPTFYGIIAYDRRELKSGDCRDACLSMVKWTKQIPNKHIDITTKKNDRIIRERLTNYMVNL